MTVEDPRRILVANQVTDGATDDRWLATSYRCSCGFASDDAGEFDRHLDTAEGPSRSTSRCWPGGPSSRYSSGRPLPLI